MKEISPVVRFIFLALSLCCVAAVLWSPRDTALKLGQLDLVWAGLGNMNLNTPYRICSPNGKEIERRLQIGPVLAVYEYSEK